MGAQESAIVKGYVVPGDNVFGLGAMSVSFGALEASGR
jgi:hypothetical protein